MEKRAIALLAFVLLVFTVMPGFASAAQSTGFEKDFAKYLERVSKERGFTVTEADIEYSLSLYEDTLDNFETVEDLEAFLGEVIQKDGRNLRYLYEDYEISKEELGELLAENGETSDDYVFVDDLYQAVDFYLEARIVRDPDFDKNLEIRLKEVSKVRGFTVTREDVVASLARYEESLDNFKTIDRLFDFLGEIIKKDLSNLDYFTDLYDVNKDELLALMKENGLDINDYIFIDDLDQDINGFFEDMYLIDELSVLMEEYGLTMEEMDRLEAHFLSIFETMDDETLEQIFNLADRMMAFEDFDTATELTPKEAAELLSIYKEFISIFQLKVDFSLIQDGTEKPLSLTALFNLTELVNADLKISLYNVQGEFLADLIITGEMVDSESLHDTGQALSNGTDKPTPAPVKKTVSSDTTAPATVKGGELPKTASNYGMGALAGLFIISGGIFLFRKTRATSLEK
ncbi:peptidase [Oceanobacillus picturae]|uniref:Peptidase n=1 Tax=Oceanobacillus picturae TaxID=171693 RepID=A0A0U9H490_9BACI|nr:processed acidic surface protein [Oceanobacillus picturae]GAQ16768.1 peptidase [Oceanobacillus picturae]